MIRKKIIPIGVNQNHYDIDPSPHARSNGSIFADDDVSEAVITYFLVFSFMYHFCYSWFIGSQLIMIESTMSRKTPIFHFQLHQ